MGKARGDLIKWVDLRGALLNGRTMYSLGSDQVLYMQVHISGRTIWHLTSPMAFNNLNSGYFCGVLTFGVGVMYSELLQPPPPWAGLMASSTVKLPDMSCK